MTWPAEERLGRLGLPGKWRGHIGQRDRWLGGRGDDGAGAEQLVLAVALHEPYLDDHDSSAEWPPTVPCHHGATRWGHYPACKKL